MGGCNLRREELAAVRVGDRLYEEVIDMFNLRLTTEPLSLLTSRLDTFVDPPAEPNTPIWPCLVNRPGLDLYAGPCEGPAGAHRGSFVLCRRPRGV